MNNRRHVLGDEGTVPHAWRESQFLTVPVRPPTTAHRPAPPPTAAINVGFVASVSIDLPIFIISGLEGNYNA